MNKKNNKKDDTTNTYQPNNMVDQESTQGFIRITYYHGLLIAGGFTILGGLIGRGSIIISLGAEIKPIKDLMPALLFMKPSGQQSGNLKKKGVLILRLSSCRLLWVSKLLKLNASDSICLKENEKPLSQHGMNTTKKAKHRNLQITDKKIKERSLEKMR